MAGSVVAGEMQSMTGSVIAGVESFYSSANKSLNNKVLNRQKGAIIKE
jgi:hypothetical protein